MRETGHSSHYSVVTQPKSQLTHSDAEAILRWAHEAVRYIAALDSDRAATRNGLGFSKSDVSRGHPLTRWHLEVVVRSRTMAIVSMVLARK